MLCLTTLSANEYHVKEGRNHFSINGVEVAMNYKPSKNADCETLLIGFHGAVDRQKRSLPVFLPFLPSIGDHVHQLMISDPSLRMASDLKVSWFAGDQSFDAQKILADLFYKISHALGVRRVIYFGTSAGGFAALYYSKMHKDSLAFVSNPQTAISKYYNAYIKKYVTSCWPRSRVIYDVKNICIDLLEIYNLSKTDNHVVYIQNSTDHHHLYRHMAPFISSISSVDLIKKIVFDCSFTGKIGHSNNWEFLFPWLQAVCISTDWMANTIIENHYSMISKAIMPSIKTNDRNVSSKKSTPEDSDLRLAALLRDCLLKANV
jgi:hypothetical protein